jgi:hypothetical protein
MPISTKDEILYVYADLVAQPINKQAADAVDYTNAVGSAIAMEIGGAVAFQAVPAAIAALKAGTATGLLTTILTDIGITTGAAGVGVSGPALLAALGGPIGVALGVAALGYGIYELTKLTDDNLDDLISRLEAIDEKAANGPIADAISKLQTYKPYLSASKVTPDPSQRAAQNKEKLDKISELLVYLKAMQAQWSEISSGFTDWGFDPSQAKTALDKTTAVIQTQMAQMTQKVAAEAKALFAKLEEETGKSLTTTAQSISALYKQMVQSYGSVTFDTPEEQAGFDFASKILQGQATQEDAAKYSENMFGLYRLMQKTSAGLSKQPAGKKAPAGAVDRQISKRALTVGGKKFIEQEPGTAGQAKRRQISNKNPDVETIQRGINAVAAVYAKNLERVAQDGIYGPKTSNAILQLMKVLPGLREQLATYASATEQYIVDFSKLKSDNETLSGIANVFSNLVAQIRGQNSGAQQSQQDKQKQRNVEQSACVYDKPGMNSDEIAACLPRMMIEDTKGEPMNAVQFLSGFGYNTPEEWAEVIRRVFQTHNTALPPFNEWMNDGTRLVNDVSKAHGYEQSGAGQFNRGQ